MVDTMTVSKESICFFNCTGVAAGYLSADGNQIFSDFAKKYTGIIPRLYMTYMSNCVNNATGKNGCEKAYNWKMCMMENTLSN